jgi:hypothetical protein
VSVDYEGLAQLRLAVPGSYSTTTTTTVPAATSGPDYVITTPPIDRVEVEVAVVDGPGYVVWSPEGVFRVEDTRAVLVVDRDDVAWAADDGMGGVVYQVGDGYFGTILHDQPGESVARTISTGGKADYVSLVEGRPTLVMWEVDSDCWGDATGSSVLVDLQTGVREVDWKCWDVGIPYIAYGVIGDRLRVSKPGEGWEIEGGPLPSDQVSFKTLDFRRVDLPANPYAEPSHCSIGPLDLSPDGSMLVYTVFAPEPTDFGVSNWEAVADLEDKHERWYDLEDVMGWDAWVVDLGTGESTPLPGPNLFRLVVDFDGRFLALIDHPGAPRAELNLHLIDTWTGEELPIDWGAADQGDVRRGISLLLRRSPDRHTDAPDLAVTSPEPDDVLAASSVVFSGTTCPGCVVSSGSGVEAIADGEGHWKLTLELDPGVNWETFTAIDPAGHWRSVLARVFVDPASFYTLDGERPDESPPMWTVGFVSLGTTLTDVEAELGPADRVDDGAGYYSQAVHHWDLPGGAVLTVEPFPWQPEYVMGVTLEVPVDSPIRFGLHGGISVGGSTVGDLIDAWGAPTYCADVGRTDCDFFYSECMEIVRVNGSPYGTRTGPVDRDETVTLISLWENQDPAAWETCGGG